MPTQTNSHKLFCPRCENSIILTLDVRIDPQLQKVAVEFNLE